MLRRTRLFLLLSLLCSSFTFTLAQTPVTDQIPQKDGERARYNVQIDIRRAYISGVCSMLMDGGMLKASLVNEFGLSALTFEYNPVKDKVTIVSVIEQLDHWYIKRVLRKDLRELILALQRGETKYEDTKHRITYTFSPMKSPNLYYLEEGQSH